MNLYHFLISSSQFAVGFWAQACVVRESFDVAGQLRVLFICVFYFKKELFFLQYILYIFHGNHFYALSTVQNHRYRKWRDVWLTLAELRFLYVSLFFFVFFSFYFRALMNYMNCDERRPVVGTCGVILHICWNLSTGFVHVWWGVLLRCYFDVNQYFINIWIIFWFGLIIIY